jgi:hypothetical protein
MSRKKKVATEKNKYAPLTGKLLSEQSQYYTHDLGCAAALVSAGFALVALDKENPRKVGFIFRAKAGINGAVDGYFSDKLKVNARTFFDNLRMLKNRIYGQ